jgi:hypothetical protein
VSLIAYLAPHPGSTISSSLGLSFRHWAWRRETFQRLNAVAGAVAHLQQAMMMDIDQAAKAMRDEGDAGGDRGLHRRLHQPTYRGMRIDGQRVATWSSQRSMSGL